MGKALEMGLTIFGRWSRKRPKWINLDRSVATALTHRLWSLFSSPTQHISVLAAAFDKTCYYRESSRTVPPSTTLPKAVELSQPSLDTLLGDTSPPLKDILTSPCSSHCVLRYLKHSQRFGEDSSLLKCVPFVGW